jgi:cytochrome c553
MVDLEVAIRRTSMHKFAPLIFLASFTNSTAFAEGNYDKGKELANSWECINCHGLTGNTTGPERQDSISIPKLAGQPVIYLVRTLNQYKTRARVDDNEDSRMSKRAGDLSDQEIEDIAAYFSVQKRY